MDKNYNPNRKWTFEEKEAMVEQKRNTIVDQDGFCWKCGKPLMAPYEAAHRIPKTIMYIKKYGWNILNHPLNLPVTHKGCNSGVLLDPKSRPREAEALIKIIEKDLEEGKWNY